MKPVQADRDAFQGAGDALYGAGGWVNRMASDLEVQPRTVARWLAGKMPIPPSVWADLAELISEAEGALAGLAKDMRDRAASSEAKLAASRGEKP